MCSRPMWWEVFGVHVVGSVRGTCCGTGLGPMLWDVFRAPVVGCVRDPCCGSCSGPMLWDVFQVRVAGRVRGQLSETGLCLVATCIS